MLRVCGCSSLSPWFRCSPGAPGTPGCSARQRRGRWVTVLLCCCLLASCEDDTARPPPAVSQTATDLGLPACGTPPSEDPTPPPPGAVLPPTARLTAVREGSPRTQLTGYIESTPAIASQWIETQSGFEIISSNVTLEQSEFLVTDGTWRTYVKVRAVCSDASLLSEVIAAEGSGAQLPSPAGTRP